MLICTHMHTLTHTGKHTLTHTHTYTAVSLRFTVGVSGYDLPLTRVTDHQWRLAPCMIGITSHDQSDSCSPTARAEELHPKIKRARFLGPAAVCPAGCCGKLHVGVELCSCSREEISLFVPNKEPLSGVTFRNQLLRHKQISLTVSLTSDLSHLLLQSSWQDFS